MGEEAETFAGEVERWIPAHLGRDYPWPGDFREIEQCVRNLLIRREYLPPAAPSQTPVERLTEAELLDRWRSAPAEEPAR